MLETVSAFDLLPEIQSLYDRGLPPGESTGYPSLDAHYTVQPGQWTVVTGVPGHGKSEWLDSVAVNLAWKGWRFIVFSPENQPHQLHIAKLAEKFARRPFRPGSAFGRMSKDELQQACALVDHKFSFLRVSKEFAALPSLVGVIESACSVMDGWIAEGNSIKDPKWKVGIIIDPWNEMDHGRPNNLSETEYISACLSAVRQFARDWSVHVWMVAHPAKIAKRQDGTYPTASLWDISGSAHWANKCDNGITVWRDVMSPNGRTHIHVLKVRFRNIGKPGVAELDYDRDSGCYIDPSPLFAPPRIRMNVKEEACPI